MSREQRRADRKQQTRTGAPPPSRRTPVKVAGGSRLPTMLLAILGGLVLIVGLLVYLILQSNSGGSSLTASEKAEQDQSTDIPGTFFPTQGRAHFPGTFAGHQMTPFCPGVAQSDSAKLTIIGGGGTPSGTTTVTTSTPAPSATPSPGASPTAHGTIDTTPTVPSNCYATNPPSSGKHLNVQRNVDIGGGAVVNIPADPDVYPDDIEIPRDAIAHILEHAGVFVGWNCQSDDTACADAVQKLKDVVNDRIDNHGNRVVMAHDNDLPLGTFGISAWTRVLDFPASEWDQNKSLAEKFIATNSCRFDPEGFCH
jgi:Protein of unknown function (DUF3105)